MATQVVIFSVMLFGMSGVVLDFGRVYNEHSRMQAFTDQAALAAASQLDRLIGTEGNGATNSIQRAVNAVFDSEGNPLIQKSVSFGDGENGDLYRISHLFFLRELSDDAGDATQFGDELLNGNMLYMYTPGAQVTASDPNVVRAASQARYVVAVGEERSLRNSLMNLVSTAESSEIEDPQSIRTISIAEVRQVTNTELSNFAVCNPWEGNAFQSAMSALETPGNAGMHFHFRAYGEANDPDLSQANAIAVLSELQGVQRVRQICENPLTLPGFNASMSDDEIARATEICYLSAAVQTEILVNDDVLVEVADPEVVTTALNTVFDLWDQPIAGVLDWDLDANGFHSQHPDFTAAAHPLREDASLFQPALNIMKGRVRDERLAVQLESPDRPRSSRLNYPRTNSTSRFETLIDQCVRPDNGLSQQHCFADPSGAEFAYTEFDNTPRSFISQPITSFQLADYYSANFPGYAAANPFTPPALANFTSARGIEAAQLAQWSHHDGPSGANFFSFPTTYAINGHPHTHSGEDSSLLDVMPISGDPQFQARRCVHDASGDFVPRDGATVGDASCYGHDDDAAFDAADPRAQNAGSTNQAGLVGTDPFDPADETIAQLSIDRENDYTNFTWQPEILPEEPASWNQERRLFDVTLVNCGTATAEGDALNVEVEAFAQMYLLAPPRVTCPDGTENCPNDQISFVDIYTEFVGAKDYDREFYAVLVR